MGKCFVIVIKLKLLGIEILNFTCKFPLGRDAPKEKF